MNQKIEHLLQSLREAIHDAIGDSCEVAAAMSQLEREGQCPSLLIDVTLPQDSDTKRQAESPSLELVTPDGPLYLTAYDGDFLRNLGITTAA
ncbi:MAG TPA: hypothetical protein VMH05_23425 [Bryobacteraceae bacterium]|nr:hypothetical protein [Bryobacteraceae bacterium]